MRHFTIGVLLVTAGCTSVNMLGTVGPKALQVYSIKDNGVLTASGMLVILNSDGEVAGVVGGTVQGGAPVTVSLVTGLATAGAIGYAGLSLSDAIRHINIKAGGAIDLKAPQVDSVRIPK